MITFDNLRLLKQVRTLEPKSILLLGEQHMNVPSAQAPEEINAAEWLTTTLKVKVEDLDNNGDAKRYYDLSKYSGSKFSYDVVADFGTTEHVEDPANCIRNVFAWANEVMIFVNPSPGYYDPENHDGCVRFTTEFWEAFAELTKTDVVLLDYKKAYFLAETAEEARVILQKTPESVAPKKSEIKDLIDKYCEYV